MTLRIVLGAVVLFAGMSLFGCSHTEAGLEQDARQNAPVVQKAADNAEAAAKRAAMNVEDASKKAAKSSDEALEVTPKVKMAIISDKELNNSRNTVNVDTEDNVVHLRGTVYSQHLKNKAGKIANETLAQMNSSDRVSNELKVSKE